MSSEQQAGVSRREFVKAAGLAMAAPALGGVLLPAASARPIAAVKGSDQIKVGLIGCGGRGTGAAVQALRADPGVVLHAMGDVFEERLKDSHNNIVEAMGEEAAQRVKIEDRGFAGFDAAEKVIGSGADVILLVEYPAFRPAHLKLAIDSGKHVFAEKPVAIDAPGVRSVLASAAAAKEKNLALLVGFCWRYHGAMREIFTRINDGAIGEIVSVHTTYHTSTLSKRPRKPEWSDAEFQMRNWWHFTWLSGDHIVEQAIHSVDRMAWALGDKLPVRCQGLGGRAAREGPEHGNVYDHFTAIYEYGAAKDSRRAFHTCRQIDRCPSDNSDYIYGTTGSAFIDPWAGKFEIKDLAGNTTWAHSGPVKDMYQQEHDELFASIRAGKPLNYAVRDAHTNLMAIMGRMAAYTGQTITWDQAMNSQESLVPAKVEWGAMETPAVAIPGKTKFI